MRHSSFTLWIFPLVFPLVMVCSPAPTGPADDEGFRDLGNGMNEGAFHREQPHRVQQPPQMVQIIGESQGQEIAVRSVTRPNFGLQDHWADGAALGALVIYQQLFDRTPVGLPSAMVPVTEGLPTLTLPSHLTTLLQESAAQTNAEFGIR